MSDKETKALIDETTNEVDDVFPPSQSQSQVPDSSDGAGDGKASVVEEGPDDQEVDDAFAPSQSQSNVQESIACAGEAKASAADQGGQPQELDQEKQVELEREKQLLSDEKLQEEKNRLFWQKIRAERERKKAVAQRKRDAAAMQKDENEEVHGKVAKNQVCPNKPKEPSNPPAECEGKNGNEVCLTKDCTCTCGLFPEDDVDEKAKE